VTRRDNQQALLYLQTGDLEAAGPLRMAIKLTPPDIEMQRRLEYLMVRRATGLIEAT
jgi:hypothetical protein